MTWLNNSSNGLAIPPSTVKSRSGGGNLARRASRECEANAGRECAIFEAALAAVARDDFVRFGCDVPEVVSDCGVIVDDVYARLTGFCGVAVILEASPCTISADCAGPEVCTRVLDSDRSFSAADSDGVPGFDNNDLEDLPRGDDGADEPLALALLSEI